jgi:hypothetical protein
MPVILCHASALRKKIAKSHEDVGNLRKDSRQKWCSRISSSQPNFNSLPAVSTASLWLTKRRGKGWATFQWLKITTCTMPSDAQVGKPPVVVEQVTSEEGLKLNMLTIKCEEEEWARLLVNVSYGTNKMPIERSM